MYRPAVSVPAEVHGEVSIPKLGWLECMGEAGSPEGWVVSAAAIASAADFVTRPHSEKSICSVFRNERCP